MSREGICRRSSIIGLVLLVTFLPGMAHIAHAGGPVGGVFPIRDGAEVEVNPAIAYNSQWQEYLVVLWNDRPGCDDIRAERVSKDGKLLGGRWVAAGCPADRRYPDVAYNPQAQQYLVSWVEESGGFNFVKAQRLSADAQPVGGEITLVAGNVGLLTPRYPVVAYAFSADKYLVVWEYEVNIAPNPVATSIVGHVVFADGSLDPAGAMTIDQDPGSGADRGPRQYPDLAYNVARNEYLVVWQRPLGPTHDIYARRITGHGELLFPEFIQITPYSGEQLMPAVAALPNVGPDGQYLVTWEDHSTNIQIHARRINGDGSEDGSHFFVLAGVANRNPAIAASESARRYLVVATREGGAANDTICGQEVSPTTDLLSPGPRIGDEACFGGPSAEYPALAAGPIGGFLAAWQDKPVSATNTDVYGQLWGNRVYLPLVVRNH